MEDIKIDPIKATVPAPVELPDQAAASVAQVPQIPPPQDLPAAHTSASQKKAEAKLQEVATKATLAENKARLDIIQKLRRVIIDARQFRVNWGLSDSAAQVFRPVVDAGGGAGTAMANAQEMTARAERGLDEGGQFLKKAEEALKRGDLAGYQEALKAAGVKINFGLKTQSEAAETLGLKDEQKATWARFHRDAAIDIGLTVATSGGGAVAKGSLQLGIKAVQTKLLQALTRKLGENAATKLTSVLGNRFAKLLANEAIVNSPRFMTSLQDALLSGKPVDKAVTEALGRYAFDTITGFGIGEGLGAAGRKILSNPKVAAFMKSLEEKLPQGIMKGVSDWVGDRLELYSKKFGQWRQAQKEARFLEDAVQHSKDVERLVPSAKDHDLTGPGSKKRPEMVKAMSSDVSLDKLTEQILQDSGAASAVGKDVCDQLKDKGLRGLNIDELTSVRQALDANQGSIRNADQLLKKLDEGIALKIAMKAHNQGSLHHEIWDAAMKGNVKTLDDLKAAFPGRSISENELMESTVDVVNAWRQARGYDTTRTWQEIAEKITDIKGKSPLLGESLEKAMEMQRLAERSGQVTPWAENMLYYRLRSAWVFSSSEILKTLGLPSPQR